MARPREFDEQQAIERAMDAFWTGGYDGTSTERLCEATRLGRSSIYNTFGSKQELLRKALRRYDKAAAASRAEILDGPGPVRERLRRLLSAMIDDECDHDGRGCLAVNTALELRSREPAVAREIRQDFARMVSTLRAAVEAGQRAGEIDKRKDARALALYLHSSINGLRVMARVGHDRASLDTVADVIVGAL